MSSLFGGGGNKVGTVNPPKPIRLKPFQLENQMVSADQAAYNAADNYMSTYYPALTEGRNQAIGQAFQGITGPVPPQFENASVNEANMGAAAAFGGGDQSFGLGQGSLARNSASASVAQNAQGYEDYNRGVFSNLTSLYAPRSFGMTPEDAANIFTFNNTQMNNYLEQQFAAETQSYYTNAGLAQQAAGTQAGVFGSLASAAIPAIVTAIAA